MKHPNFLFRFICFFFPFIVSPTILLQSEKGVKLKNKVQELEKKYGTKSEPDLPSVGKNKQEL